MPKKRFCKLLCFRYPEKRKIQGTYFKISALYFKIYGLCFSQHGLCFLRRADSASRITVMCVFSACEMWRKRSGMLF